MSGCYECSAATDTPEHSLAVCPALQQRHILVTALGELNLSLPNVVRFMLESDRSWAAMDSFCEGVISQKKVTNQAEIAWSNGRLVDSVKN